MEPPRWHICATASEIRDRAVAWIVDAAAEAITRRGVFRIVLAGGETPRGVYENLRRIVTDWCAWEIWFSDERCLATDDPRRNHHMVETTLLGHIAIPPEQVHVIPAELGADKAVEHYRSVLADVPDFDLVLLGLGEDGHTASLFPGGEWGESPDAPDALAVYNAPKLPLERVSLSARRLARTRCVLFLVSGVGKRAAVDTWRAGARLPVSAICPPMGIDILVERVCTEAARPRL